MIGLPKFKHPLDTREGRIERAVWTLRDGARHNLPVFAVLDFLASKGVSDQELTEALYIASAGELLRA